jgi:hypothetical protein
MSADFCFLALPTEAWRGAEIRTRSVENVYANLPGTVELLAML